jgi:hypothetical protein
MRSSQRMITESSTGSSIHRVIRSINDQSIGKNEMSLGTITQSSESQSAMLMKMVGLDLPIPTPQSVFDGLFDLSSGGLPGSQAELQVQDR